MLAFYDPRRTLGRRDFLRVGSLAMSGVSLGSLLQAQSAAGEAHRLRTGKSVIFLFLQGGPSQFETFDPKMSAPAGVRSATGEIATTIPGVTFGSNFPKLAELARQLTIVRSFATGDANHDVKPLVCRDTFGASLGALYARGAGATDPASGMPRSALLYPRAVDPTTGPEIVSFGNHGATGALGAGYAPFIPGAGANLQQDMRLKLSTERLDDRRELLAQLDRFRRSLEASGQLDGLDALRQQAFSTILRGVAGAFDLAKEDPGVVARYDTAPLVRPDQINRKWKNYNHYVDNAKSLGKLLLLARRLCEAGCGMVTVTTSFVWDMHADENNATMVEGMRYMAPPLDHAVSALVDDLRDRGLGDRVLLVCCGEMGRTPRINARGGRDHWGNLAPLMLFGAGMPRGAVIGQSSRDGGMPASEPLGNKHLIATVLRTLLDPAELRIARGMPNELVMAGTADPIPGIG
jgi:Protein of unknown function (DUF1501)